jgi:hexosaminidase
VCKLCIVERVYTILYTIVLTLIFSRLNVLHWHMIDAESFPINTPSEPTMIQGAFSKSMIYSLTDIQQLFEYAYQRGIEIILEYDMPGHAAGWNAGKPSIMADCFAKYYYNINDFALNPTLEETYTTIQHILSDTFTALGSNSQYIHLGGDEVVYGCWREDPTIVNFYTQQQYTSYDQVLNYFVTKVDTIVSNLAKDHTVIHWEEVFTAKCNVTKSKTIFEVWTDSSKMAAVTAAGYQVIAAPSNYWYLNIASNTWQSMYSYDPATGIPSNQQSLIVGGETALWGEYVDDNNIEVSLYPRTCTVAEKLWSPASLTTNSTEALARLLIQRCRLVNRGIHSAPVQPGSYCSDIYV